MSDGPARFQEIDPQTLSDAQALVLQKVAAGRGRVPTPFKVWLHSEKLASVIEALGTMLNTQSTLSERELELAFVLIGQHWDSPFVTQAHLKALRRLGVAEPDLALLHEGKIPDFATGREKAIIAIYRDFDTKSVASDETFALATTTLGRDGLAELIALFGYYTSVAMAMKLHRMPLP